MSDAEQIRRKMSAILGHPADLPDDAELTSLVNSSFILVEMLIEMQEEYGIRFNQADMQEVTTVGQLIQLFVDRLNG